MLMQTSSQCESSRNHFLAHLSRGDAALLDGLLERVVLKPGIMLATSGAPLEAVYFPETVIVSIGTHLTNGQHVEAAVVGCEGIVGWAAMSGSLHAGHDAIVQMGVVRLGVSRGGIFTAPAGPARRFSVQ